MAIEPNRGIIVDNSPKSYETNRKNIDDRQFIPKKFKDVAANMEQQFAEYMLNEMNKAVQPSDETEDSNGMDYYKSLQTTERAKIMSQKKTLGLQDVILDQIYPKRLRNEMALKQYEAQAERFNHNLPKLEASHKNDRIIMGKNDSTPLENNQNVINQNKEGGLK